MRSKILWEFDAEHDNPGPPECPECGSKKVAIHKTNENTDADGRRGIWFRCLECLDCGYEICH